MNWTLLYIDKETKTCGIVQLKNPSQGQIEPYSEELVNRYPRPFGIRLIPNKKSDVSTIKSTLPELKEFEIVKFDDFI